MIEIQELFTEDIFKKWNHEAEDYEDQEYYFLRFHGEPVFYVEVPDDHEQYQLQHGRAIVTQKLREIFGCEDLAGD